MKTYIKRKNKSCQVIHIVDTGFDPTVLYRDLLTDAIPTTADDAMRILYTASKDDQQCVETIIADGYITTHRCTDVERCDGNDGVHVVFDATEVFSSSNEFQHPDNRDAFNQFLVSHCWLTEFDKVSPVNSISVACSVNELRHMVGESDTASSIIVKVIPTVRDCYKLIDVNSGRVQEVFYKTSDCYAVYQPTKEDMSKASAIAEGMKRMNDNSIYGVMEPITSYKPSRGGRIIDGNIVLYETTVTSLLYITVEEAIKAILTLYRELRDTTPKQYGVRLKSPICDGTVMTVESPEDDIDNVYERWLKKREENPNE